MTRVSRLRGVRVTSSSIPYAGPLVNGIRALRPRRPLRLALTKRPYKAKGVVVIPTRGMVEPTCGWFNRDRRLCQDDELLLATREALIQVTMIPLLIRRLARIAPD